jgi:hypothetical protein
VALEARRAELASAIDVLERAAEAILAGRGGGCSLASVTRSLAYARRLSEKFDRRWGFARDRTFGATLRVCVGGWRWPSLGVCVCHGVCECGGG